jgi:phosphatidylglycerophosphate synthase
VRLEDPVTRFVRYPVAKLLARALRDTPVTPNQITLLRPLLAGAAGWLIASNDPSRWLLAVLFFELRSILDCADGTLARTKNMATPWGHAIDAIADGLSVLLLYVGIFWHFHLYPPPAGPWSEYISTSGILLLAIFQGALRSFSAAYYGRKYISIFERGHDDTVETLRRKAALEPNASIFEHVDAFIGRVGHLCFEHEWFDPARSPVSTSEEQAKALQRNEQSPRTKLVAALWSISNGEAFLTIVCVTAVFGRLWEGQLFFASFGTLWILGVIVLNGWFIRSASRRAKLAVAPAE